MSIEKIWAREILDSRGNPTVEVDLYTAKGILGSGQPSCSPNFGTGSGWSRMRCWVQLRRLDCGVAGSLVGEPGHVSCVLLESTRLACPLHVCLYTCVCLGVLPAMAPACG